MQDGEPGDGGDGVVVDLDGRRGGAGGEGGHASGLPLLLAVVGILLIPAGLVVIFLAFSGGGTERPVTTIGTVPVPSGSLPPGALAGRWQVQPGEGSWAGYRINEELLRVPMPNTAEGRTPGVEGGIVIGGDGSVVAVAVNADLSQLRSDDPERDENIRRIGLETERYPKAAFALTSPIRLPAAIVPGEPVTVTATGDLTLHGQTRPVTLQIEARLPGTAADAIELTATTDLHLADFGIEPPDIAGVVKVRDDGTLQVHLRLVPVATTAGSTPPTAAPGTTAR